MRASVRDFGIHTETFLRLLMKIFNDYIIYV